MRKKICSRCGKIINEGEKCNCQQSTFYNNKKSTKEKDLIHSKRWRDKRKTIIKRDGVCVRCFIKYKIINSDDLTVHHIKSRKNHPELMFDDENLVCLCSTCNKQLGTKDKLDFEWDANKYKEINDISL